MKTSNSRLIGHIEEDEQLGKKVCIVEYGKIVYKGKMYWNITEMMKDMEDKK